MWQVFSDHITYTQSMQTSKFSANSKFTTCTICCIILLHTCHHVGFLNVVLLIVPIWWYFAKLINLQEIFPHKHEYRSKESQPFRRSWDVLWSFRSHIQLGCMGFNLNSYVTVEYGLLWLLHMISVFPVCDLKAFRFFSHVLFYMEAHCPNGEITYFEWILTTKMCTMLSLRRLCELYTW